MSKNKTISIIKKVLWGIFLAIFGFVAVIALWLMIDKFILKSPVPSMFGYASLTVETGSMEGTIDIGDMIIIKKQDEYKIGDIITYLHEGEKIPTTHRIVNYNEDGSFVTRGDSNNTKDPEPVTDAIIIGKVIKIIPDVGIFTTWVQTEGWIYLVASLAILGLGLFIITSDGDSKDNKSDDKALEINVTSNDDTANPENGNNTTQNDEINEGSKIE